MVDARWEDDAWRRLPWLLPAAALLAALSLGAFLHLLTALPERPPPPPALEAQVIELPPPTPPPPQVAPVPPPPPKLEPPPKVEPKREPLPAPKPKPTPPRPAPPTPQPPPTAQPPPPPAAPAPPPVPAPMVGRMSARAIYQPLPQIPDALRHRNVEVVAVALFHVAADGSATVELVQATFEPSLNRALLDTLKTWRFFPALEQGHPIASTIEIRIPISVR
jgi:protein TonB